MSYLKKLADIRDMCRICLTRSNNMISLAHKLVDCQDSPSIFAAMESIFLTGINSGLEYPTKVCFICHGHLRISYNLKTVFKKSQQILQKNISALKEHLDNLEGSPDLDGSLDENVGVLNLLPVSPNKKFSHNDLGTIDGLQEEPNNEDETTKMPTGSNEIIKSRLTNKKLIVVKDRNNPKEKYQQVEDSCSLKDRNNGLLELSPDIHNEYFPDNNLVTVEESMLQTKLHSPNEQNNIAELPIIISKTKFQVKMTKGNNFIIEKDQNVPKTNPKCSYCEESFNSDKELTQHLPTCRKFELIKCDICNRKFTSLASKTFHMRMKHIPIEPEIKCDICNQVFKNMQAKTYHKRTKHNAKGKLFVCELCGKAFYFKNSLNRHMDTHSKDVSKVVCPVCGKSFHYAGGLFYHMKVHTDERNYSCTFCKKRFLNISALKKHTRTHTGERPYSCKFCGKSFLSTGIRNNHEKTHTGVKSYLCKYCKKGFITLYSLKIHMSAHKGTQPCDFCERTFLNSEVLTLHMKFKHKTQENT